MMRSYFRLLQATHIRSTDRDRWCGNTKVSYNGCHNRHCTTLKLTEAVQPTVMRLMRVVSDLKSVETASANQSQDFQVK